MYRALPVARQVALPASRGLSRAPRRHFATEAAEGASPSTAPKKKKRILRRLVFYTTAATATYYVGSTFVAFNNRQYYEFFQDQVPFGSAALAFAEDHGWDTLTVGDVVEATVNGSVATYNFARKQLGYVTDDTSDAAKEAKASISEKVKAAVAAAETKSHEAKEKVQSVVEQLKTDIKGMEKYEQGGKAGAIAKHEADQFSEGVEDLVREAEAALSGKPIGSLPEATTTPSQPTSSLSDALGPRENEEAPPKAKILYDAPLPLGFEPPPGYSRPPPPKPPKPPVSEEAPAAPLPLVAPIVAELGTSEPVLTHLASTIDDLASFLKENPSASDKARGVLDTAKIDLTELAQNFDKLKEEEQHKLEQKLDEQAREYTLKLLELELEAQDKLDSQEAGFREYLDEEKAKIATLFREKLNHELETQRELINERLKEEVIAQGIELQRRWIREIKVRVEQERGGRLAKLDELAANLKRLERVALDNSSYLDENLRIHSLWSAIRAVHSAVDSPARKPFRDELRVLRHIAAAKEDTLVSMALEALEASDAPDVGVEPFADLASWFSTSVAPRVSSVALVPDQNAGVLSHIASHLFSSFTFRRRGLVPGDDVLSTLSRAEYYLNEKDLDSATRELNQLKGTAKVLLKDWLEAARRRLEVQQALDVVQAQATVASLLVV
ncbi:hypothetical protein EW146_g4937 [Bondarzewia mesenterica]|uniref:MICOS complex subunit MIC60 n=1 Tax=Bondarzewia mesenterica TaxID=1095465 RepID=A0A4S4LV43_9AGAM|nr:hypothetical protein EW146_g4937 [Bondarzewia mesenterica]